MDIHTSKINLWEHISLHHSTVAIKIIEGFLLPVEQVLGLDQDRDMSDV